MQKSHAAPLSVSTHSIHTIWWHNGSASTATMFTSSINKLLWPHNLAAGSDWTKCLQMTLALNWDWSLLMLLFQNYKIWSMCWYSCGCLKKSLSDIDLVVIDQVILNWLLRSFFISILEFLKWLLALFGIDFKNPNAVNIFIPLHLHIQ